jgi:hypothetical protein
MPPGEEGICRYDGKNVVSFKPKNEGWFRRIIEDQDRNLLFARRIHGVLSCNLSAGDVSLVSFSRFPLVEPGVITLLLKQVKKHLRKLQQKKFFLCSKIGWEIFGWVPGTLSFTGMTERHLQIFLDRAAAVTATVGIHPRMLRAIPLKFPFKK